MTIATTIAAAIGTLHDRGVVHRDLKPSNVFLVHGQTNAVKILDFGIAHVEASTRMTGTGMLVGTFGYMAPEQASGTKQIDARADVFALGCVLFECIAGAPVFGGSNPMAILTKILFEEAPRLVERGAGVPTNLDALVHQLLAKNPDERPRNGHAVAEALRTLGEMPNRPIGDTVYPAATPALTLSEQRAAALIFVGAAVDANDNRLAATASTFGGRFEKLLDGSAVVVLSDTQIATDLAAKAARCALAMKRNARGRRIALTMGRSDDTVRLEMGAAIDRGTKLLGETNRSIEANEHVTLDESTVGLLDARFEVLEDSGIFVLRGERDIADVRTLLGKPTPCVGRDRELNTLTQMFGDCVEESQAQVALVTGAAGMGKSRILHELLAKLRNQVDALTVWIARGDMLAAGSALSLLAEAIRGACGIRGDEPLLERQNKLANRIAMFAEASERRRITDFLGEIIGAPFADDSSELLLIARRNPQIMTEQLRRAWLDFLRGESKA